MFWLIAKVSRYYRKGCSRVATNTRGTSSANAYTRRSRKKKSFAICNKTVINYNLSLVVFKLFFLAEVQAMLY